MRKSLETARLSLKPPDPAFAEPVLAYFLRNRDFLEPWEPIRPAEFYTADHHRGVLEMERESVERGTMVKYWIFPKDDGRSVIGSVSFSNIVRGAFLSCFMGYRLDEREINRGYMTEAAQAGIGVVFDTIGLHRIEANIMPRNVRSLRVAEKLGFVNEGLARKYLRINGVWEDHIHMVLFNDRV